MWGYARLQVVMIFSADSLQEFCAFNLHVGRRVTGSRVKDCQI